MRLLRPVLAGSLLIGGWLVLGAWGRDIVSRDMGAAVVIAVWLATMGLGSKWRAGRGSLLGAAAATAALLSAALLGHAWAPVAAAVTWGVLLRAVSPDHGESFDCALPAFTLADWRRPAEWPLLAARLGMLPMMLMLPQVGEWCGGSTQAPASAVAWHLAAMLLPGLASRRLLQRCPRAVPRTLVALLLGAGLVELKLSPGVAGLMSASLLHAAAWSLAWTAGQPRAASASDWRWAFGPVTVLLLGAAIADAGPAALIAVHAALALIGLAGWGYAAMLKAAPADPAVRSGSLRRPRAGSAGATAHRPHRALAPARLRTGPP